jgi:hypothetical protein
MYLCLNARRDTGVLETTQAELAQGLHKGAAAIRSYLNEMETAGICRCQFSRSRVLRGRVEVTPSWWPYEQPELLVPNESAEAFLATVKKLVQAQPCIQSGFSTADEILLRSWFQRGLSLERIEQAVLLGCARKYASWRNDPRHGPIHSLRYFEGLLVELQEQPPPPGYWDYLWFRIQRLESLWVEGHRPVAQPGSLASAPTPVQESGAGEPDPSPT